MSEAGSDRILERMMALHPKVIDLTLDRVYRLLEAMGNPHLKLAPVIHIAGTNGKGSTLAMIRAGLEEDGKRVQTYTSPHLVRFHERIRLTEGLISETALEAVLAECEAANGDASITYFEITTVAALVAFSRQKADYLLLEVGLGGRLDATNIIDQPALSIITPVSLDHQQFLGDTLEEIAGEKAGILKPGVPAIIGLQEEAALSVIEARAQMLGVPLLVANQDWQIRSEHGRLAFEDAGGLIDVDRPALAGAHQVENAGMALAALRHLGVSDDACAAALKNVQWAARLQRLTSGALVSAAPDAEIWLDGGHNPAAGKAIAQTLGGLPDKPTHVICGMLNTKDIAGFLRPIATIADKLWAVSIPGEAATLSADETATTALNLGMDAVIADDVDQAVKSIMREAPHARILICGSLYLAGHVLRQMA